MKHGRFGTDIFVAHLRLLDNPTFIGEVLEKSKG